MRNLIGPLFLLVSCLLFSVTGTLQQLAPEGHTPVVITEVRMLLGLSLIHILLRRLRISSFLKGLQIKAARVLRF